MSQYERPSRRVHRGFFYLNDETVINSLSAFESGKVDEVVAKVVSAREGGFGGGLGIQGAKVEASKKSNSTFEEEMVRTRTRFSVFEAWYSNLKEQKAVGSFRGWGPDVLEDVRSGDTIELDATLEVAPIQTLLRLFLWFADKAKGQGHLFSQKGEELKQLKEGERNVKMVLGADEEPDRETIVLATPVGDPGPQVAMPILSDWLIGKMGRLGGQYTIVAQVDRIIGAGDELPALRLTHTVAATPLELKALKDSVSEFVEPAEALGIAISTDDASIMGPALWLTPIAVYR
jgi:hypothetical protein